MPYGQKLNTKSASVDFDALRARNITKSDSVDFDALRQKLNTKSASVDFDALRARNKYQICHISI
jgi:hypothetical protein